MINEERLLNRFLEYVQIDSESYNEIKFFEHLKKDLENLDVEVLVDDIGKEHGSNAANLIVKVPGDSDKTLLFSSHIDTVVPGIGIQPVIKDGIIQSDGTTILGGDDKAGVASLVEMLTVLKEENIPHHNIEIAFTICEEVGLLGSKYLNYDLLSADMGFVLDTGNPPGYVAIQGPSQDQITITFNGKTAHAGIVPEKGISAIMIAAEAIHQMKLLRIDEETTANIGTIHGGEATNIVADKVIVEAETRSLDEEKLKKQTDHIVEIAKETNKKYGLNAEVKVEHVYKAFHVTEDSKPVKHVTEAIHKLGLPLDLGATGGGSDTNNFNENGIPSVNLGVGMESAHTLNEILRVEDLENTARLAIEIARK